MSTNGQKAKVSHTHCKGGKAQAKRVRQSSLPSLDSDSAQWTLSNWNIKHFVNSDRWWQCKHCSFTCLTFALINVIHGILINISLTVWKLCFVCFFICGQAEWSANGKRCITVACRFCTMGQWTWISSRVSSQRLIRTPHLHKNVFLHSDVLNLLRPPWLCPSLRGPRACSMTTRSPQSSFPLSSYTASSASRMSSNSTKPYLRGVSVPESKQEAAVATDKVLWHSNQEVFSYKPPFPEKAGGFPQCN